MPDDPKKKKKDRKQISKQPYEKRYSTKRKTRGTRMKRRR
jgi:hypothetical protein